MKADDYRLFGDNSTAASVWRVNKHKKEIGAGVGLKIGDRKYKKSGREGLVYPPTSPNARRPGTTKVERLKKLRKKYGGKTATLRGIGRAYRGYSPRARPGTIY